LGHYAEARRTLLAGVTHAETLGERYYLVKLLNTVGWLHGELGDLDNSQHWNRRALEAVRCSHADRVTEAERYTLLNRASDELAAGHVNTAAEHLCAIAPLLEQDDYGRFRYINRYQLLHAEVALALGDAPAALRYAKDAALLAIEKDMPKNLAKSRMLTGRALLVQTRPRDATEALTDGIKIADRIAHGSLRWQGRLWLGQALTALHRDASEVYREAMDLVEQLANRLDDPQLRAIFRASPRVGELRAAVVTMEARLATPNRPAGLTARELDVLLLLTKHQTDKEIAATLFLSPRTVSTHVANIFNKLGVANRREAAAAATRLGLDGPSLSTSIT
jgi:DNA-binding CsgD family transcriptional regulator